MKTIFAIPQSVAETVFSPEGMASLRCLIDTLVPPAPERFAWENLDPAAMAEVELLITGWRTPPLKSEMLDAMPRLKLVANASGAVRSHLPEELWERGVRVATASSALGWGVAEFALALIVLGSKRAFWLARSVREKGAWREETDCFGGSFELFGADVGVIGAGQSGQALLQMLAPYECQRWVYDPYADEAMLAALGVRRVDSLEALFSRCKVVSLHASLNPATRDLLRGGHFRLLAPGSLFVNTARAGLIHEPEFIEVLREGHFAACLDVTLEEPPSPDHPYRTLPNVFLTPHIAGAIRENRLRLGRLVLKEVERFIAGEPLHHEVTLKILAAIA